MIIFWVARLKRHHLSAGDVRLFLLGSRNLERQRRLQLDNYTLVNVKLSQRFYKDRAAIYFGVNNLFDRNYETAYGFPQAGRFIYVGAEFHI